MMDKSTAILVGTALTGVALLIGGAIGIRFTVPDGPWGIFLGLIILGAAISFSALWISERLEAKKR